MATISREARLNAAFVSMADTLTAQYDVLELLHTLVTECTEILDAKAGGLLLADSSGKLQVVASTSERAELVEVLQLAAGEGPFVECFTNGRAVSVPDIQADTQRWVVFRRAALEQGFLAVHATPLRLRGEIIGSLHLFLTSVGELKRQDAAVAQALADVATIGILQERIVAESHVVTEQLQRALDSRVLIEQAKGVLSQSAGLLMDDAFSVLRLHARENNLTLREVAGGVVNRIFNLAPKTASAAKPGPGR
jgi:GAF domain-containing protein